MEISDDLKQMITEAESLASSVVDISSHGVYPETKRRTKVQDVAKYQNDGTATISPAKYVERAAAQANGWAPEIREAIIQYIDGSLAGLHSLGRKAARDINDMCDRIRTRRLKHSFRHLIKRA